MFFVFHSPIEEVPMLLSLRSAPLLKANASLNIAKVSFTVSPTKSSGRFWLNLPAPLNMERIEEISFHESELTSVSNAVISSPAKPANAASPERILFPPNWTMSWSQDRRFALPVCLSKQHSPSLLSQLNLAIILYSPSVSTVMMGLFAFSDSGSSSRVKVNLKSISWSFLFRIVMSSLSSLSSVGRVKPLLFRDASAINIVFSSSGISGVLLLPKLGMTLPPSFLSPVPLVLNPSELLGCSSETSHPVRSILFVKDPV